MSHLCVAPTLAEFAAFRVVFLHCFPVAVYLSRDGLIGAIPIHPPSLAQVGPRPNALRRSIRSLCAR